MRRSFGGRVALVTLLLMLGIMAAPMEAIVAAPVAPSASPTLGVPAPLEDSHRDDRALLERISVWKVILTVTTGALIAILIAWIAVRFGKMGTRR